MLKELLNFKYENDKPIAMNTDIVKKFKIKSFTYSPTSAKRLLISTTISTRISIEMAFARIAPKIPHLGIRKKERITFNVLPVTVAVNKYLEAFL